METTNNNINEKYADLITKKAAKESEIRMLKHAHECDRRAITLDTEKKLEVCRQHIREVQEDMADLTKERDTELRLRHDAFIAKKDALLGELAAINAEMARIKMPEEL